MEAGKIYKFASLIVDTVKHEIRKVDADGERVVPVPRLQVFNALIYLIENRHRVVGAKEVWNAVDGDPANFGNDKIRTIISECRSIREFDKAWIKNVGKKLYR